MKKILLLFILATVLYSCEKVSPLDNHYYIADTVSGGGGGGGGEEEVVKKVLLIDFTGVKCNNCPNAHRTIHQLEGVYPEKIVAVAIHGTAMARPYKNGVDLRTDAGKTIINELGITAVPIGLVDKYDKNSLTQLTGWTDQVANVINEAPEFGIKIENSFDDATNKLNIAVDLKAQVQSDKKVKLVVFVIEDGIITKQADKTVEGGVVEEYEQKHVFRGAVSDIWGDAVFANGIEQNGTDKVEYAYDFNAEWNAENSKVVAFLIDETSNVLNAQEKEVK